MMSRIVRSLGAAAAGVLLAMMPGPVAAEQPPAAVLRLDANAVNLSGVGRTTPEKLEIVIKNWSTEATREKLIQTLKDKGPDRLLDALQSIKPSVGYIRTTTSLGWDIQYASETRLPEGGRRIVFATDRPISFREASLQPRSAEYEFMLCEIHLDRDGIGEGKLATMAKISYDKKKNLIEIENYGIEPVRLTRVTTED
ncbi:MAG: hypothetical protein LJF30_02180 [Acidobacteria bacterium]|nr:hypothetical protein [Acidobacteriota bacterium]